MSCFTTEYKKAVSFFHCENSTVRQKKKKKKKKKKNPWRNRNPLTVTKIFLTTVNGECILYQIKLRINSTVDEFCISQNKTEKTKQHTRKHKAAINKTLYYNKLWHSANVYF